MGVCAGDIYGHLTVVERVDDYTQPSGRIRRMWKVKCSCGVTKICREDAIKKMESCGCKRNKDNAIRQTKHSESKSRLYRIRYLMISRCCNEHSHEYSRYGGRGISVCDEWLESYDNFARWAYANGYNQDDYSLSLERNDVNGNYCPENCKWIPIKDQYNNMRKTIKVGDLSLAEFCRRAGLNYSSVKNKYYHSKDIVYALGFSDVPRKE